MPSGNDPKFQADLVFALDLAANHQDYAGCQFILSRYYKDPRLVTATENETALPNLSFWIAGDQVILLSGGVRELSMWGLTLNGWEVRANLLQSNGYNSFAWKIVQEHIMPVKLQGSAANYKYTLVGTSLGGMVCHAYNELQRRASGKDAELIVTVGSPRALAATFLGTYSEGEQYHFRNVGDPIPSFPPRFSEAPILVPAAANLSSPWSRLEYLTISGPGVGPPSLSLWPLFYHPPGGLILHDDGETWECDGPSPNAFLASRAPTAVQALQGAGQVTSHATEVYVTNLRRRFELGDLLLFAGRGQAGEGGDWGLDVDPSFMLPVDPEGRFMLPLQGGFYPMAVNPIKTQSLPGATGGRIGALVLNGEIIAVFPTRSKAATAARALRRFLSRLPAANEVSLSGLMTGMSSYLQGAQRGRGVTRKAVVIAS